jgi:hypothetical protein
VNAYETSLVRSVMRARVNGYAEGEREARRDLEKVMGTERAARELRSALANLGATVPPASKPRLPPGTVAIKTSELAALRAKAKKPPAPAPEPEDVDDEPHDDDDGTPVMIDWDEKPAKKKTKTQRDPLALTVEGCFGVAEEYAIAPPPARDVVAKNCGIPRELALKLTDAQICGVAPAFAALAKTRTR